MKVTVVDKQGQTVNEYDSVSRCVVIGESAVITISNGTKRRTFSVNLGDGFDVVFMNAETR